MSTLALALFWFACTKMSQITVTCDRTAIQGKKSHFALFSDYCLPGTTDSSWFYFFKSKLATSEHFHKFKIEIVFLRTEMESISK